MAEQHTIDRAQTIASVFLRIVLSGIFAYAGIVKLLDLSTFYSDVQSYRIFPTWMLLPIIYFVPVLELVTAVGLCVVRYRMTASVIFTLLMLAFTLLLALSWLRGVDITCGCFGKSDNNETDYFYLLLRDLALLTIASANCSLEIVQMRKAEKK